jgi:hypothetical protein
MPNNDTMFPFHTIGEEMAWPTARHPAGPHASTRRN